jgi:hypothetical protein
VVVTIVLGIAAALSIAARVACRTNRPHQSTAPTDPAVALRKTRIPVGRQSAFQHSVACSADLQVRRLAGLKACTTSGRPEGLHYVWQA